MTFESKWQRNFGLVLFYNEDRQQYMLADLKLIFDPMVELPMNIIIDVYENNFSYLYGLSSSCEEFDFYQSQESSEFDKTHIMYYNICGHEFKLTFEQTELLIDILDIKLDENNK